MTTDADAVKSSPRVKKSDLNSRDEEHNEQLLQHGEVEEFNENTEENTKNQDEKRDYEDNEHVEDTDEKDSTEERGADDDIENISSAGGVS